MSQVLDAMFEKICVHGEHIIDQEDDGDNFYVIERWPVAVISQSLYCVYVFLWLDDVFFSFQRYIQRCREG